MIDPAKWCGSNGWYDLTVVHTRAGYDYATNGAAAIRRKSGAPDSATKAPPNLHELIDGYITSCTTFSRKRLPHVVPPAPVQCSVCKGSGHVKDPDELTCPWCEGSGEVDAEDGLTHECGRCDGEGTITAGGEHYTEALNRSDEVSPCAKGDKGATPCDGCGATGLVDPDAVYVQIGSVRYDTRCIAMLKGIAGLEWGVGRDGALIWRAGEYEGLVMGVCL